MNPDRSQGVAMLRMRSRPGRIVVVLMLAAVAISLGVVAIRSRTVGLVLTNGSTHTLNDVVLKTPTDRVVVGRLRPGGTFRGSIRPVEDDRAALVMEFQRGNPGPHRTGAKSGGTEVEDNLFSFPLEHPPTRPAEALELQIKDDPVSPPSTVGKKTVLVIDLMHRHRFQLARFLDDLIHLRRPGPKNTMTKITIQY
jgi:hypothetical protein